MATAVQVSVMSAQKARAVLVKTMDFRGAQALSDRILINAALRVASLEPGGPSSKVREAAQALAFHLVTDREMPPVGSVVVLAQLDTGKLEARVIGSQQDWDAVLDALVSGWVLRSDLIVPLRPWSVPLLTRARTLVPG